MSRVMPGKPHSPFPHQQKPYIVYKKEGKALDQGGSIINKVNSSKTPEAHIPIEEFAYRD